MAYRLGDLKVCREGEFDTPPRKRPDWWDDEKNGPYSYVHLALPHSCDEWEIGGIRDAENLIADLLSGIEELRRFEKK